MITVRSSLTVLGPPLTPFHKVGPSFSRGLALVSALSRLSHSSGPAPLTPTPAAGSSSLTPAIQGLPTSMNLLLAVTAPDQSLQHHT